jgi:hypothetical protein
MFDEMISMLKKAETVPQNQLRKRFDRAMVKKLGVLKTPYSFWPSDKKINPSAKELLWAAILLEDKGDFRLTEGIIATEVAEKQKASGQYIVNSDIAQSSKKITSDCINEFLELAPSKDFRKLLENKINKLLAS